MGKEKKELTYLPVIKGKKGTYKPIGLLGAGAFGFVIKVLEIKTKKYYAMKNVNKTKFLERNKRENLTLLNEKNNLSTFGGNVTHVNHIIQHVDFFQLDYNPLDPPKNKKDKSSKIQFECLVVQFCDNGDLCGFLSRSAEETIKGNMNIKHKIDLKSPSPASPSPSAQKRRSFPSLLGSPVGVRELSNKLPLRIKIKWFLTVLNTFSYIHQKNILHLDMKPDNILLTSINSGKVKTNAKGGLNIVNSQADGKFGDLTLKVSDFGSSINLNKVSIKQLKSQQLILGNIFFTDPSLILRKDFSLKNDVWSIALIFFSLLFNIDIKAFEAKFIALFNSILNTKKCVDIINEKYNPNKSKLTPKNYLPLLKFIFDHDKKFFWKNFIMPTFMEEYGGPVSSINALENNCFVALLREMLAIDHADRISISDLLNKNKIIKSFKILLSEDVTKFTNPKEFDISVLLPFLKLKENLSFVFKVFYSLNSYEHFLKLKGIQNLFSIAEQDNYLEITKIFTNVIFKGRGGDEDSRIANYGNILDQINILLFTNQNLQLLKNLLLVENNNYLFLFCYLMFSFKSKKVILATFKSYFGDILNKINFSSRNENYVFPILEIIMNYVNEKELLATLKEYHTKAIKKEGIKSSKSWVNVLFLYKYERLSEKGGLKNIKLLEFLLSHIEFYIQSNYEIEMFLLLLLKMIYYTTHESGGRTDKKKYAILHKFVGVTNFHALNKLKKSKKYKKVIEIIYKLMPVNESKKKGKDISIVEVELKKNEVDVIKKLFNDNPILRNGVFTSKLESTIKTLQKRPLDINKILAKNSSASMYLKNVKETLKNKEEYQYFIEMLKGIRKKSKGFESIISDLVELFGGIKDGERLIYDFKEFLPISKRAQFSILVKNKISQIENQKKMKKIQAKKYMKKVKSSLTSSNFTKFKKILLELKKKPKSPQQLAKELYALFTNNKPKKENCPELLVEFKSILPLSKRRLFWKIAVVMIRDYDIAMKKEVQIKKKVDLARRKEELRKERELQKEKMKQKKEEEREKKQREMDEKKQRQVETKRIKAQLKKALKTVKKRSYANEKMYNDLLDLMVKKSKKTSPIKKFKSIVKDNKKIFSVNKLYRGFSILHYAIIFNFFDGVKYLVNTFDFEIDLNLQTKVIFEKFQERKSGSNDELFEIVKQTICEGLDEGKPFVEDKSGNLMVISQNKHVKVTKEMKFESYDGLTPLLLCIKVNAEQIFNYLLKECVIIKRKSKSNLIKINITSRIYEEKIMLSKGLNNKKLMETLSSKIKFINEQRKLFQKKIGLIEQNYSTFKITMEEDEDENEKIDEKKKYEDLVNTFKTNPFLSKKFILANRFLLLQSPYVLSQMMLYQKKMKVGSSDSISEHDYYAVFKVIQFFLNHSPDKEECKSPILIHKNKLYNVFLLGKKWGLDNTLCNMIIHEKLSSLSKFSDLWNVLIDSILKAQSGTFRGNRFEMMVFKLFMDKFEAKFFLNCLVFERKFVLKNFPILFDKIIEILESSTDIANYFRNVRQEFGTVVDEEDDDEEDGEEDSLNMSMRGALNESQKENDFKSQMFNNLNEYFTNFEVYSNESTNFESGGKKVEEEKKETVNEFSVAIPVSVIGNSCFKVHREILVLNCSDLIVKKFLESIKGKKLKGKKDEFVRMRLKHLNEKELLLFIKFLYLKKISKETKKNMEMLLKFMNYSNNFNLKLIYHSYLFKLLKSGKTSKNIIKVLLKCGYLIQTLPNPEIKKRVKEQLREIFLNNEKFKKEMIVVGTVDDFLNKLYGQSVKLNRNLHILKKKLRNLSKKK